MATLKELLKKDPKDITPEERDSLGWETWGKIVDKFSDKYDNLISQAIKNASASQNTVLVFCDGKLVETFNKTIYDITDEEIEKIEQKYGKVCYAFSNVDNDVDFFNDMD